jgi:1-acyl-sn-glycerol-3-phosphate acyltransferase
MLQSKGPLIIAANHPNSFLDAIILATLFEQPIYSLARGDAFGNKILDKILAALNILPVYRLSEGAENIGHNYKTFDACQQIFNQNGIVLIFSEGLCINEWHLRPLKKGTARIAITAWENNIPLQVLPLGINYDTFAKFGKNVHLNFGNVILQKDFDLSQAAGKNIAQFNQILLQELQPTVYEIDKNDVSKRKALFYQPLSSIKKTSFFLPAIAGIVIHFPLYFLVQQILLFTAKGSDHFDALFVSILFIIYPFYWLSVCWLVFLQGGIFWGLGVGIALPLLAMCAVQMKPHFSTYVK